MVDTQGISIDPSRNKPSLLHRRQDTSADFIHVYQSGKQANLKWMNDKEVQISVEGQLTTINRYEEVGLHYERS